MYQQDVVLVNRPVDHLVVWPSRQQVLVEPLAALLKGLREGEESDPRATELLFAKANYILLPQHTHTHTHADAGDASKSR